MCNFACLFLSCHKLFDINSKTLKVKLKKENRNSVTLSTLDLLIKRQVQMAQNGANSSKHFFALVVKCLNVWVCVCVRMQKYQHTRIFWQSAVPESGRAGKLSLTEMGCFLEALSVSRYVLTVTASLS